MLHKSLDKKFSGFQVPFIPRAARSSRKRSLVQKNVEDNQLCAFDLLATIAGKILLEEESSHLTPAETDSSFVKDVVMEENEMGTRPTIDINGDPCVHSVVGNAQGSDSHCIENPEILERKFPEPVNSDCSVKFTLGNNHYPCRDNNVNVASTDDNENSSECIQSSTMNNSRLRACISGRRIRKMLASNYWRMASRARDGDFSGTEVQCLYRDRKMGYKRLRSQRLYSFKKRRFYHSRLFVNGSSACVGKSVNSTESRVKLRIKSVRVPELFIEMPETATVGSLKRTVMQAVLTFLGGGLNVGVLHQGKKIKDDNRTLLQSGFCNDKKVKSLGFSLEPNPPQVGSPVFSTKDSRVLATEMPQLVPRCPITNGVHQESSNLSAIHLADKSGTSIETDRDSTPYPVNLSSEKCSMDSCAIVALPEGNPQPLSVVYSQQNSKRSDTCQRRIRRPFSASEVEALVLAVEKLGTGRWRDVKLRDFDNANHRTYVDLKDKWKTLVHTARIAPQQRRGEPVPQELLDRVLAAQGYWAQQQPSAASF